VDVVWWSRSAFASDILTSTLGSRRSALPGSRVSMVQIAAFAQVRTSRFRQRRGLASIFLALGDDFVDQRGRDLIYLSRLSAFRS
jgi:hypothetical protein